MKGHTFVILGMKIGDEVFLFFFYSFNNFHSRSWNEIFKDRGTEKETETDLSYSLPVTRHLSDVTDRQTLPQHYHLFNIDVKLGFCHDIKSDKISVRSAGDEEVGGRKKYPEREVEREGEREICQFCAGMGIRDQIIPSNYVKLANSRIERFCGFEENPIPR